MAALNKKEPDTHFSTPLSHHVADPAIRPFLASTFDPADYLNKNLPSLSIARDQRPKSQADPSASLPELLAHTQATVSQLSAHTSLLSTALTQLADDILRTGGRLSYEVEVLVGESQGLHEVLTDSLKEEIANFVPSELVVSAEESKVAVDNRDTRDAQNTSDVFGGPTSEKVLLDSSTQTIPELPPFMSQLQTLTLVRNRLENVIKVFGEMHGSSGAS
ncbi:MAG: hypothetical protein M1829_003929 [Trizodia sp. TS-e1964]|nr:MAG: hypothetical protein M1829_003929 [Trizodia sp. TS-e1964]